MLKSPAFTLNAVFDVSRVSAAEPDVAVSDSAPVVRVSPFEAVRVPALVIVPLPVVEMLFEVEMVLVVAIEPKPEAMEPEARAPVEVREEVVTPEPRVVADKTSVPLIL
jgi:hypothetical protein